MAQLSSSVDKASSRFQNNKNHYLKLLEELEEKKKQVQQISSESLQKHTKRGKLTARKRIELLIDKKSHFLEFSQLAALGMYGGGVCSAGLITGVGVIHQKECVIVANDATVKGGTYFPITVKKHLRAQEIALENGLPCVYLVDSGGAYLPLQADVFPDKEHFGRIFYNQARMSAEGLAQISAVMGSCTAGGAYVPAMSDENVIVEGVGTIFLGGPPLVKAATGEEVTAEQLGGGKVHSEKSGVTDHLASSDKEALEKIRDIFQYLKPTEKQKLNCIRTASPLYDIEDIYGIIPYERKIPFEIKEIISRLVDASEFYEFKKNYGSTLVTGWAHLWGIPVGIVANNGILFSESALKGTHFIELCDQRKTPLIFLQNITGFMVGREYETKGIAKEGAKMVMAVSNTQVPKFTVIVGGSYGAGNYGMCGRAYQPRQLWMWPNAHISVMGGEQASQVLIQVNKNKTKKELCSLKEKILEKYEKEGSCYYSTARLWDDGVIDPKDTRRVLALGLKMSLNKKFGRPVKGVFRM